MLSSAESPIATRARNASPIEEYQIRLRAVAPPLHLADHEVAALLHETRTELVENDGTIRFTHAGLRREYYHPDSPTCQNRRGQKVVVAVSRNFADVLFVVTPDRQYLDTIPLKENLAWFNYDQLGHEIREQEIVLKRAAKNLENLHGDEIQRRAYAGRGNVEKVEGWREQRIVTTFSAGSKPDESSGAASASPATGSRVHEEVGGSPISNTDGGVGHPALPTAFPSRTVSVNPTEPFSGSTRRADLHGGTEPHPAEPAHTQASRENFEGIATGRSLPQRPNIGAQIAGATNRIAAASRAHKQRTQRTRVSYEDALDDLAVPLSTLETQTQSAYGGQALLEAD